MATGTTTGPNPNAAERQGQVIQHHQNFRWRNFVELRDGDEWITASIHETHRFRHQSIAVVRRERAPLGRFLPAYSKLGGKMIDHHEADVVARAAICWSEIPQA